MNLFWFHPVATVNAEMHCDKHVVKMILELAQMLSCAHHVHNSPHASKVYRKTHVNHPCTKWTCENRLHYHRVFGLFKALLAEYTYRYHKVHASERLIPYLQDNPCPSGDYKVAPQAMPDEYKNDCLFTAYKNYFNGEKQHIASWTNRPIPHWFEEKCNECE